MKKVVLVLAFAIAVLTGFSQSIAEVKINLSVDTLTGLDRVAEASDFYMTWGVQGITLDTNAQALFVYYNRVILDKEGNPYKTEKITVRLSKGSDGFNTFVNAYAAAFTPLIEAIIKENEHIE